MEVPEDAATVGQLVRKMLSMNWLDGEELREDDVFLVVRAIVSEQTGVAEEKIRPETRFIQDLHMD